MLKKELIEAVKINQLFHEISKEYGYDVENYLDELFALIEKWEAQQYVEIYKLREDRVYGRAKSSDTDGNGHLVIEYIGIYHARLRPNFDDPLVVIKFCIDEQGVPYVSVRFITDHNQLFGFKMTKYNRSSLSVIRKAVDKNIKDGDSTD